MLTHLTWESAGTEEAGDQNADSDLGPHAYWALGPCGQHSWSVELIQRDDQLEETSGGVHLGHFPAEAEAKQAAEHYEQGA